MSEASHSQSKTAISQLISILDRAWDTRWAIQLIQLVLFLDLAMLVAGQPGLLGWDSGSTPVLDNLNFVIVTLAAFTVYAAFMTPMLSFLARATLLVIPGIFHILPTENHEQPYNHVSISEYGKEAFRLNKKDMIIFHQEMLKNERDSMLSQRQAGNVIFGTAIIIGINAFPAKLQIDPPTTLLQTFISFAGIDVSLMIGSVLAIALWIAITTAWFYHPATWIEQHRLYLDQQKAKRAERMDTPTYWNS